MLSVRNSVYQLYLNNIPGGSEGKESACNMGELGSIPELGRYPGEGKSYSLQYSGLENSMDCIVHGITKSRTRLSDFHFRLKIQNLIKISICGYACECILK